MRIRLLNLWETIQTSFWFIPGLMIVSAVALSQLMIGVDKNVDADQYRALLVLYSGGADGARSILSTIAGSMMTVAGVTFSITIVALTLASSQFGPRLLRNFMRNKGNQLVLGVFVSTFIYCLLVLQSVNSLAGHIFVPHFSISVAIALALLSISFLIYFIHSISTSIHADHVIATVYADISDHIEQFFPLKKSEQEETEIDIRKLSSATDEYKQVFNIVCSRTGYVQAIDYDELINTAKENDCLIELKKRAGDFVVKNGTLARMHYSKSLDEQVVEKIIKFHIVGAQRTPEQDTEFAIDQLVEVALRALSPGINDPLTAITCIDHLGAVLSKLAAKQFPLQYRYDDNDRLRMIARTFTFAGITNTAFDQIRQNSEHNVAVSLRLLENFTTIASHCSSSHQMITLLQQAEMIVNTRLESIPENRDKESVQQRFEELLKVIDQQQQLDH